MLRTLSKVYGKVVARRNRRFDNGTSTIVTVDKPVISVGNVLVGGTGKTPVVQLLVRMLSDMGHRPAIVMRGYKRSSRGLLVVHDGQEVKASARESGDEAMLHATKLDVPVVVCESKVDAAVHAAGFLPCDVIIVDDGFQHRALHRDMDIVLVNKKTVDDGRLLPAGRLREPIESLKRADVVMLTGTLISEDEVREYCSSNTLICKTQVVTSGPDLDGKRLLAFAGIADPERFVDTVRGSGANVVATVSYDDHHIYTKTDIEGLITRAKTNGADLITTEKDRVKLDHALDLLTKADITLHVLPIDVQLTSGKHALESHLQQLFNEDRDNESSR